MCLFTQSSHLLFKPIVLSQSTYHYYTQLGTHGESLLQQHVQSEGIEERGSVKVNVIKVYCSGIYKNASLLYIK